MQKLPPIETGTRPEAQLNWLRQWFTLWHAEQQLPASPTPEHPLPEHGPSEAQTTAYSQTALAQGEIRLLSPHTTPEAAEPVYVAVFSEWRPIGYLLAPFSRFPAPGLPGELYTGRPEPRLRVLNVWNSYSLEPTALINRSWIIGQLDEATCQKARAVFRHVALGHPLDDDIEKLVAPPVHHPEDPRIRYQDEDLQRLAGLGRLQSDLDLEVQHMDNTPPAKPYGQIITLASKQLAVMDTQQLAAADSLSYPVLIMRNNPAARQKPVTCKARATQRLVLHPDLMKPPTALWTLLDVPQTQSQNVMGADVLFWDTVSDQIIATGQVDDTGSIIKMDTLFHENLTDAFDPAHLVLLITPPE